MPLAESEECSREMPDARIQEYGAGFGALHINELNASRRPMDSEEQIRPSFDPLGAKSNILTVVGIDTNRRLV